MTSESVPPDKPVALTHFRSWFWQRPRAHGEIEAQRSVSFLELFYDLVYVVVISQAAHHLAGHVSIRGYAEFAIVFGLVWIAWVNGTLYYELHGREDGRTRTFIFLQMGILALLAVYTGDAAGRTAVPFAGVYALFLVVMTWLWYRIRRHDRPEYMAVTARYLIAMVVSFLVIVASIVLPTDARLILWAGFVLGWLVLMLILGWQSRRRSMLGVVPTESMVERFDLLVIIVLGEIVVGVVDGLSTVDPDLLTLGTGMLALVVGFGLWWIYFDFAGRRLPRADGLTLYVWMESHLPFALAIVGAGAAMVALIAHAHDARTPKEIAWLLAGSVSLALVALVGTIRCLADYERQTPVYRPLTVVLLVGALGALLVGWWQPVPWLLASTLVAILSVTWAFAVQRFLAAGAWAAPEAR